MDKEDSGMILIGMVMLVALGILILVSLLRVILGPTAPDRLIALDAINTLTIALLVVVGVVCREIVYVDVAIVYSMLSFVSILYISRYLEGMP
jgi:multicomponent Na+:H+ antiporter subunit F